MVSVRRKSVGPLDRSLRLFDETNRTAALAFKFGTLLSHQSDESLIFFLINGDKMDCIR